MTDPSSQPVAGDTIDLTEQRPDTAPPARTLVSLESRSIAKSGVIVLSLVAAFLLALWLYGVVGHFLFLLLLAWLLAVAMDPGIRFLVGHGRSRGMATALVGGAALLTAVVIIAVFGELFFQQASDLVANLPSIIESAVSWLNNTFHTSLNAATITASLSLQPGQVAGLVGSLSGGLFGVVDSVASIVMDLATVLVFGFYIAAAGPHFLQAVAKGLRPNAQRVFVTVADITARKTGGYVGSKIILAALSALAHGIVFALIGVPNWLPYAIFVGITSQFVPLVGTYIGVALPVLATAFVSPWKAVVVILFAVIYQQVENYVFTPRISKKTMDVNPAIALAAVFLGAAVWGPIGAIIGIPLVAAAFAIADTYSSRYELIPELAESEAAAAARPASRRGRKGRPQRQAESETADAQA